MGIALLLVVLFRLTQARFVLYLFFSVDWLGLVLAATVTSWVFPGDRIQRGVSIATFFDLILIIATGLQCGIVGFVVGLLAPLRRVAK